MIVSFLWRDRGGVEPCPSQESVPTPFCSWVLQAQLGDSTRHFPFSPSCRSCCAIPNVWHRGQDPYPNVLISFSFTGRPFRVSGIPWHQHVHACFMHVSLCLFRTVSPVLSPPSQRVCVVKFGLLFSQFSSQARRDDLGMLIAYTDTVIPMSSGAPW